MEMQRPQKIYPLRKARLRRQRRWKMLFGILTFFVFCAVIYGVLQMECWKVKVMEVKGVERIDPERVYREVNIDLGDHMLLLSTSKIEYRLMKFPLMKQVRIYRHIPSRIVISVTERQPYAYIFFGERYYLVDDEAVLLEEGVEVPKKLDAALINVTSFKNNGVGKTVAFPYVARLSVVCGAVRKSLGGSGWKISMTADGIKVYLKSGFFILLGDGGGVGRKMAIVPVLLGSMHKSGERFEGLNLRFFDSPSFIRKSVSVGSGSGT